MTDETWMSAADGDGAGETSALRRTEAARLDALRRMGEARDSVVIAYITSIRDGRRASISDGDTRILERHLAMARKDGAKNIDLVICTHGGDAAMPWNFHAMFRDYFPKARLGVFVPFEAYSAGTLICLGCDEIVLGRTSVLGPVDGQIGGQPVSNSFASVMALMNEIDPKGRLDPKSRLEILRSGVSSLDLGFAYRAWKEDRRVILNALATRRQPLTDRENNAIADYFIAEVGYHGQGIRRREALKAGVSFVTELEKTGLEDVLGSLFERYVEAMRLFAPVLRGPYEDDDDPADAPLVVVESLYETNAAFRSGRRQRDWTPPHVPTGADVPAPFAPDRLGLETRWTFDAHQAPPAPDGRPASAARRRR